MVCKHSNYIQDVIFNLSDYTHAILKDWLHYCLFGFENVRIDTFFISK